MSIFPWYDKGPIRAGMVLVLSQFPQSLEKGQVHRNSHYLLST